MRQGAEQRVFKSDDRRSRFWFRRFCIVRRKHTALDDIPSEAHAKVHFHEGIGVRRRASPHSVNSKAAKGRAILAVARRIQQREQCNCAHHPEFLLTGKAHRLAIRARCNAIVAQTDALLSDASRRGLNLASASRARLR